MTAKPLAVCAAALIVAAFAFGGTTAVDARQAQKEQKEERFTLNRAPGTPLLAVVALAEQRITIYDAKGKILESPVSSGQTGYETPAGIYSIVQKEEEHHSNLYDDASMPFMERITWTGMALHSGVLPGYPASHGCVRLPYDFAQRLFDLTNMGMRVVAVREDIAPAEFHQPFLFGSGSARMREPGAELRNGISPTRYSPQANQDLLTQLKITASQKNADAQAAGRKVKDLKMAAAKAASEAAAADRAFQIAEGNFARAEANVKSLEQTMDKTPPDKAGRLVEVKDKAVAAMNAVAAQRHAASALSQSKAEVAARAQAELKDGEANFAAAIDAADGARLDLAPVSVFVSRKTMRLYVRKGNIPIYEGPVMIRDAGAPIGSFVYTALEPEPSGGMRWNVVSMYKDALNVEPPKEKHGSGKGRRNPFPADTAAADAALQRLTVPQEATDIISRVVLPGSSLIISDEPPSMETGKDTDFVVFMSGEPQGGIAVRAKKPESARRRRDYEQDWWGRAWSSAPQPRDRRSRQPRAYGGGWGGGGGWGFPF